MEVEEEEDRRAEVYKAKGNSGAASSEPDSEPTDLHHVVEYGVRISASDGKMMTR